MEEIAGYKGMRQAEREFAVHGAFESSRDWGGKSVLLIDDVATTGSTVRDCVRALKEAGASEVRCLALAKDQHALERRECPVEGCGGTLRQRKTRDTDEPFWGCSNYPDCRHMEFDREACPKPGCDGVLRRNKNGKTGELFRGCTNYPKCKYTVNSI